ncbi:putative DNA-binding domain-containing protein [Piscinibacter sakaiensis]|uniref:HvfC/BufC family peptide modification chaperone n=1 Tax=Piscinibacter sakaiensis TaxID=1547922 RepID=UPI003AAB9E74
MSALEARFAAALLDPSLPAPPALRSWNGSDVDGRLAIYRNNVISSLVDALGETFPVVQELVGEEFFRAMAAVYVRQDPPRSRILASYGAGLAEFLESFEPVSSLPYLPDVARLEFARVQACHSADAPVATATQVAAALSAGARIGRIRFDWHPSLAVIESEWAIVSLFAAHQGVVDIASVDPAQPETAVVLRDQSDVVVLPAAAGLAAFVAAVRRGSALAEAAGEAASSHSTFDLALVLGMLHRHGAIASIHLPLE